MMKKITALMAALGLALAANAQIGYQVALINQTTGEPRANETVSVTVTISNNAGATICSQTKSATTNGAGILSLEVGNSTTFENVDWSKLPLWVSAKVGDITIGRTQILNVPVAEHAKHYGDLTVKILTSKTWTYTYDEEEGEQQLRCTFRADGTGTSSWAGSFRYHIVGNTVIMCHANEAYVMHYIPETGQMIFNDDGNPIM